MNKFINILKELSKIIVESFVYLLKEIRYSVKSLCHRIFAFLGLKKQSTNKTIEEIIIENERKLKGTLEGENNSGSDEYTDSKASEENIDNNDEYTDYQSAEENISKNIQKDTSLKSKKIRYTRLLVGLFLIISLLFTFMLWDLPDYHSLESYTPPLTTRIYSEEGNLLAELAIEKRLFVPLDSMPNTLKEAFISAEDKSFYEHFGIDFHGLFRALFNNVRYFLGLYDNIEGASTITQQVVKNFLLNNDKTIRRKIREAILTFQVELAFSKDHILELYLNEIYLGRSSYGVSTASLIYFNKPVTDLNLQESAFLASLPKAPSKYDPRKAYDAAKERRDWVIGRMLSDNRITKEEAQSAIASPIIFSENNNQKYNYSAYATEEIRKNIIKDFGYNKVYNGGLIVKTTLSEEMQRQAHEALRLGIINFDSKKGYRGVLDRTNLTTEFLIASNIGTKTPNWLYTLKNNVLANKYKDDIYPWRVAMVINVNQTKVEFGLLDGNKNSLDLSLNKWAKEVNSQVDLLEDFNKILKAGDVIIVEMISNAWRLRQIPQVDGALVALNPQTGEILAMQGGFSFKLSEFNRATQAVRQPGSAFKPFVYLSAIQKGRKTTDKVLDSPMIMDAGDKEWRPGNNKGSYGGFVTIRNAIEQSRNLSTLRIADNIGLDSISRTVLKLGLYDKPLENMSEVLGSKETTLLKVVNSYASIVNGGKKVNPNLIRQIQDKTGQIIFRNDVRDCKSCNNIAWKNQNPPELEDAREQVIDPVDAAIMVSMLQGVVERGTGRRARFSGYNIGGKTGTTNDVKDAWFVGFTPDLVVGIYFGADNPVSLGDEEGATSIAVPVFANFIRKIILKRESLPFRTPSGIEMKWVNYKTGEPGTPGEVGVILDMFRSGTSEGQRILLEEGKLQEFDSSHDVQSNINDDGIY